MKNLLKYIVSEKQDTTEDEIIRLWKSGETMDKISRVHKFPRRKVRAVLRQYDLHDGSPGRPPFRT